MEKKELLALLYRFLDALYRFEKREQALYGVSWQELYLLKHLQQKGDLSVGETAELLAIKHFEASRLCARLEDRGLVRKDRDRENRRTVLLQLSEHGEALLDRTEDFHMKTFTKNLSVLQDGELSSLVSVADKIHLLFGLEDTGQQEGGQ